MKKLIVILAMLVMVCGIVYAEDCSMDTTAKPPKIKGDITKCSDTFLKGLDKTQIIDNWEMLSKDPSTMQKLDQTYLVQALQEICPATFQTEGTGSLSNVKFGGTKADPTIIDASGNTIRLKDSGIQSITIDPEGNAKITTKPGETAKVKLPGAETPVDIGGTDVKIDPTGTITGSGKITVGSQTIPFSGEGKIYTDPKGNIIGLEGDVSEPVHIDFGDAALPAKGPPDKKSFYGANLQPGKYNVTITDSGLDIRQAPEGAKFIYYKERGEDAEIQMNRAGSATMFQDSKVSCPQPNSCTYINYNNQKFPGLKKDEYVRFDGSFEYDSTGPSSSVQWGHLYGKDSQVGVYLITTEGDKKLQGAKNLQDDTTAIAFGNYVLDSANIRSTGNNLVVINEAGVNAASYTGKDFMISNGEDNSITLTAKGSTAGIGMRGPQGSEHPAFTAGLWEQPSLLPPTGAIATINSKDGEFKVKSNYENVWVVPDRHNGFESPLEIQTTNLDGSEGARLLESNGKYLYFEDGKLSMNKKDTINILEGPGKADVANIYSDLGLCDADCRKALESCGGAEPCTSCQGNAQCNSLLNLQTTDGQRVFSKPNELLQLLSQTGAAAQPPTGPPGPPVAQAKVNPTQENPANLKVIPPDSALYHCALNPSCNIGGCGSCKQSGEEVTQLQQVLLANGYYPKDYTPTGKWDAETEAALRKFQSTYSSRMGVNLCGKKAKCDSGSDGLFGPRTGAALIGESQSNVQHMDTYMNTVYNSAIQPATEPAPGGPSNPNVISTGGGIVQSNPEAPSNYVYKPLQPASNLYSVSDQSGGSPKVSYTPNIPTNQAFDLTLQGTASSEYLRKLGYDPNKYSLTNAKFARGQNVDRTNYIYVIPGSAGITKKP